MVSCKAIHHTKKEYASTLETNTIPSLDLEASDKTTDEWLERIKTRLFNCGIPVTDFNQRWMLLL